MTKPMRTCEHCGARLDPCERCDCQDDTAEGTATVAGSEAGQQATPNPHEPVLDAGA